MEHGLLSATEAFKKGLLKDTEILGTRERIKIEDAKGQQTKLKNEIYFTPGLMPAHETYGKYGVMFRKRTMEDSKYLNTIPGEKLAKKIKSKLTFVVPDKEYSKWSKKHPDKKIIRESEVPESKRLPARSYFDLVKRVITIPKLKQETETITI